MPKLSLEERVNKLRDEAVDKVAKKTAEVGEEIQFILNNFILDDEANEYLSNIVKAIKGETE